MNKPKLEHKVAAYKGIQYIQEHGTDISTGLFEALGLSFESFLSTCSWSDEKTDRWERGIEDKLRQVVKMSGIPLDEDTYSIEIWNGKEFVCIL